LAQNSLVLDYILAILTHPLWLCQQYYLQKALAYPRLPFYTFIFNFFLTLLVLVATTTTFVTAKELCTKYNKQNYDCANVYTKQSAVEQNQKQDYDP